MAAIGIVLVSHSAKIAEGIVDVVMQMAPNVAVGAAGGTDDGGIGTSFDKIMGAIDKADSGAGAVIFCDLGSAFLASETAVDFLEPNRKSRIRIAKAPLVEGAVAASVAAETGGGLNEVLAAAASAAQLFGSGAASGAGIGLVSAEHYTRRVTLINKDGLHARPAAEFVKLASGFDAEVTVNGTDAKSLLGIMSLGLIRGTVVELEGRARDIVAVDALAALIESGFGEDPVHEAVD
jgi:PTS hybrid protein